MRNIFKDFVNCYKLIRISHRSGHGKISGRSIIQNILEAGEGSKYMYSIGGIENTTVGNIDAIVNGSLPNLDSNTKITGVILFIDT